jgi:putative flavoprotein involved in K+ transport
VAVIGGGQAGLSMSWHLKRSGIDHVVFEKERAGHAWRAERWDTFCLVTPNWQCQLPGFPYQGPTPTASCCAMRSSTTWTPSWPRSIRRCSKA